jgi:hypothetical protein
VKSATHCQLLLPGMFHELAVTAATPPALRSLLRVARRHAPFEGNQDAWRCHFFGVKRQQDVPVAPFACLGEGIQPDHDFWLCVNPVSLQMQRDSFVLASAQARGLSLEQARKLTDALNLHFTHDGLRFFAAHPDRWYLRVPHVPKLETYPLSEAIGQNVQRLLPQGDDALRWHQRLNEFQMLLHHHHVNQTLEAQGEMPVNSLWLWGGGQLIPARPRPKLTVWAHDPFSRGLAHAHGSHVSPLPSSASDWPKGGLPAGEHLLVLDQLEQACLTGDVTEWQQALLKLDTHWFSPVLEALRDGTINELSLHFAATHRVSSYTVKKIDFLKFWCRAKSLGAYLG